MKDSFAIKKGKLSINRQEADVAERLRRLTRNQIPSGSVGSNPTVRVNVFRFLDFHKLQALIRPVQKNKKS